MKVFLVVAILSTLALAACTRDNTDDIRCVQPFPGTIVVDPNNVVE